MKSNVLRPDGFAVSLFALGLVMVVVPMLLIPGLVSMLAAAGYWLTMLVVGFIRRGRA